MKKFLDDICQLPFRLHKQIRVDENTRSISKRRICSRSRNCVMANVWIGASAPTISINSSVSINEMESTSNKTIFSHNLNVKNDEIHENNWKTNLFVFDERSTKVWDSSSEEIDDKHSKILWRNSDLLRSLWRTRIDFDVFSSIRTDEQSIDQRKRTNDFGE